MTDTEWQDGTYGRCVWGAGLPADGYHRMLRFATPITQIRGTKTVILYCEHAAITP